MIDPARALAGLPPKLRKELVDSYSEIVRNFVERRWEPSELRGGKFAEVAYCIVNGAVDGAFPPKATKPKNMADACRALEGKPANSNLVGDKSLRVFIPRALVFLFDIRNQRGVGHVGGDVDPNSMDASVVIAVASWVMAELVRIFHNVSTAEAQEVVGALVERKTPLIWDLGSEGIKRVLVVGMGAKDQLLLLLHHSNGWVATVNLRSWIEYQNSSDFRKKVLQPLHKARLIEFDAKQDRAKISPLGATDVEQRLLKSSAP